MKKTIFLALASILVLAIGYGYAVEVTLLGPRQYSRTTEAPNVYAETFPGRPGTGKIIVQNGGVDGVDLVSGAIIKVNGIEVFGVSDFNQAARYLEAQISLMESNSISIELRSKPGTYLVISLYQEIEAEGAGVVGPAGGTIMVSNPESPILGAQIDVPPDALDEYTIMTLNGGLDKDYNGTSILTQLILEPSGLQFEKPVNVTLPFNSNGITDKSLICAHLFSAPELPHYEIPISSYWTRVHIEWASDLFVGVQVGHFSILDVSVQEPIYTIMHLPGKFLKESDLIYAMALIGADMNSPNAFDWFPGHAALYLGTDTATVDMSTNDGSTIIESVPGPGVSSEQSFWAFRNRSDHLYMGARRPGNGLTPEARAIIADFAIDKMGSPYWFWGKNDAKGKVFSCVGLTEASYEAAGIDLIPNEKESLIIYPIEQFKRTEPVDEITVEVGTDISFQVRGVLLFKPYLLQEPNYMQIDASVVNLRTDLGMRFNDNVFSWIPTHSGTWNVIFQSNGTYNGNTCSATQSLTITVIGGTPGDSLSIDHDYSINVADVIPPTEDIRGYQLLDAAFVPYRNALACLTSFSHGRIRYFDLSTNRFTDSFYIQNAPTGFYNPLSITYLTDSRLFLISDNSSIQVLVTEQGDVVESWQGPTNAWISTYLWEENQIAYMPYAGNQVIVWDTGHSYVRNIQLSVPMHYFFSIDNFNSQYFIVKPWAPYGDNVDAIYVQNKQNGLYLEARNQNLVGTERGVAVLGGERIAALGTYSIVFFRLQINH